MADDFELKEIFAELGPTPRRWLRAARVASITALGASVTATMQIANPLGLTMLVNLALPEAAFSFSRGVAFLCCAAIFQTLALATAGALVNSPALNLAAFVLLSLVTSYLIYAVPTLGRLWIWIQVPAVTAFYMVLFVPTRLGWDNNQMFAGLAIAVALLLLFNNLIWPEPADAVLAESLVATLKRSRVRLARLMLIAVGNADPEDDRQVASQLGHHVALLNQIAHQSSNLGHLTRLLSSVMRAERIHNEVNRLASLVRDAAGAFSQHSTELRQLTDAIEDRLDHMVLELRQLGSEPASEGDRPSLPPDLSARLASVAREYPELAAVISSLDALFENDSLDLSTDLDAAEESASPSHPSFRGSNAFLLRFAVRHTLALAIAFLIGLWDNTQALHAAIWLLMLGGPPSHGATLRKFTIRALGSSGALALAALGTIIAAPNYTSLIPYIAVIFVGTLLMTYIGEGGGVLSYLAIGGTAFVIAYSGPGPRSDVLASIWSVWGISLGMIIRAVLTLLWREHPYRTLAEEFQAPLAAMVELSQAAEGELQQPQAPGAERKVIRSIQEMLSVANDAQLEGRSAGIDPTHLIDALDTMLRLGLVLASAARLVASGEAAVAPPALNSVQLRLAAWLESLRAQTESGNITRAPLRKMINDATVPLLEAIPAQDKARVLNTPIREEFDRRMINLTEMLELHLTAISMEP
jgi:hypothetical protein